MRGIRGIGLSNGSQADSRDKLKLQKQIPAFGENDGGVGGTVRMTVRKRVSEVDA
jgi:hypothetical protein